MELKRYQQEVLDDIALFIDTLNDCGRLDTAFARYWNNKGVSLKFGDSYLHPYRNDVQGVPNVTVKVPTAGGKTFIACNALKTIFDHYKQKQNKVVVWFVPSDTILTQTYKNLKNPLHPYRQRINTLFNNAVQVVDKESALMGNGISPTSISEQLTIFVLSVQSFVEVVRKGKPRAYRENGNLNYGLLQADETRIKNADETSLIQYIANLNPVVIIDESHNFEADLRVDLLNNINPCFILDLTATPREKSNIISFVDAMKLKRENMVKLPVIVSNCYSKNEVIVNAITLQRNLEKQAKEEYDNGGKYIRPIVLFQAEPKSDKDTETYEKVKHDLVACGIPEEQIKIKTGDKNELKNIDLLSEECPVRYIITVNALKEGWDCPFAYVLATIANRSSRVDVEQILGRILRQPYTKQHQHELLNMSFVFTCSKKFDDTIQDIVKSLNNAGFSSKDYRTVEPITSIPVTTPEPIQTSLFSEKPTEYGLQDEESGIDTNMVRETLDSQAATQNIVSAITQRAGKVNQEYTKQVVQSESQEEGIPTDIMNRVNQYGIKDLFANDAQAVSIPNFYIKSNVPTFFNAEGEWIPLTQEELLHGFDLTKQDRNIDFEIQQQIKEIDLDERQRDEYVPMVKNLNDKQLAYLKKTMQSMSHPKRVESVASAFVVDLSNDDTVSEVDLKKYVCGVLEDRPDDELANLLDIKILAVKRIKDKIQGLKDEYAQKRFEELCDTGKIECREDFHFPQSIIISSKQIGIPKGLYTEEEGKMNDLERQVIAQIANLENLKFWHRNLERGKGFRINGYLHDHYPDFIVVLKSGKVILVETKGDDRDNSDSKYKIKIGKTWEYLSGPNYRYYMVFKDSAPIEGSVSVNDLLKRLKDM